MSNRLKTNLASLRFSKRMTQKAVSEATGIGQKTLSALETGASKGIEFSTMLRLCEFFNCAPGDLFVIEEEIEEIPVSDEARDRARELVARGLQVAMQAPLSSPDEVWARFDATRLSMQEAAQRAESKLTKSRK